MTAIRVSLAYRPVTRTAVPQVRRRSGGFTLIELLVTLAVAAVLLRLAVPSFTQAYLTNRLASYANAFVASATLARSEGLKRGGQWTVRLCASDQTEGSAESTCPSPSSAGWQKGWIVWAKNNSTAEEVVVQRTPPLNSAYRMTGGASSLTFPPTGTGVTTVTLTLCRATPTAGNQERVLQVYSTGRVTANTTRTGTCS